MVAPLAYGNQLFSPQIHKKQQDAQLSNFLMAKGISEAIRTSLGPHGMDKVILSEEDILITNDGATILKNAKFDHPAANMLVDISRSQDSEVGDGTTTVVVLSGSFLGTCIGLIKKGLTYHRISEAFQISLKKAKEVILDIAIPVDLKDTKALYHAAYTSLESKVVSSHSYIFAPIAVESVVKITNLAHSNDIDLDNIRIIKKIGGTIEQTELLNGLGIENPAVKSFGGPSKIIGGHIALIQFCLNSPSTDTDSVLVINNYSSMDKILREERQYITSICRKIKFSGCNVLLVQKSILKNPISDLALQILAQMKVMVIKDIPREDIPFILKSLGCVPIVDIESFSKEKLGYADLVEEKNYCNEKIINFQGIKCAFQKTATIVIRSSNKILLDEAVRSFHDALCVIRSLVRRRFLVGGGGSVEIEVSTILKQFSKSITGLDSYCINAFAGTLEIIPYTISENAGLEPIEIVSKLRKKHKEGNRLLGIDARKGMLRNMVEENVVTPLLVTTSIFNMSIEFAIQLLKIDNILDS
mmetsp:Transcript_31388/g.48689  ORF Transcript_31388/g.48689 Transcript_31388/m.48689 type:complete len:530 (+) Transcript_31388:67-1656(+)